MRQFIAESELDIHGCLAVEGKKFHYLRNVLRIVEGDMILVRLPDGSLQQMTAACVDEKKKNMVLQIAGERTAADRPSDCPNRVELWLFQFIAKPAKMELIVRQAVECGVSVIVPVKGTFCQSGAVKSAEEASAAFGKGGRWDRIITEAREQSGSPVETRVEKCVTVQEACILWMNGIAQNDDTIQNGNVRSSLAVVLYEQTAGTQTLHNAAANAPFVKRAAVAVGAEGGIAPQEVELMQKGGFIPVHFATNILRCETAALYGTAALQTVLMENSIWQNRE